MSFYRELQQQRWDDHRYYHQSRINQTLHFFSASCFLASYVLVFINPTLAVMVGWLMAMLLRQTGHFFFEPKDFDAVNRASHAYKESIKVGYNLKRKVVLLSIWITAPMLLMVSPSLFGLLEPATTKMELLDNIALMWLGIGIGAVIVRMVHLFFIMGIKHGLVWALKIVSDPFHDLKIYHKAPLLLLKGDLYDDMSEWYDDSVDASHA